MDSLIAKRVPDSWRALLEDDLNSDYFEQLELFLQAERSEHQIFPPEEEVFAALHFCKPENIKVVILGQDPYHDDDQAHGLCFSVRKGIKIPPSLRNIYKELQSDLEIEPCEHGCLESWAEQGVLLLNTVLTVRAHEANSHRKKGWEKLTDQIISKVNDFEHPIVFVLWGKPAQTKKKWITNPIHLVLESAHPSPLSASRGFFGSKPFSAINTFLEQNECQPIDWNLES